MKNSRIAAALCLVLLPATAKPCRGPFPSFSEAVSRSSLILIGVVKEVRETEPRKGQVGKALLVTVAPSQTLKGIAASEVKLAADTSTCGWRPEVGVRYLIFAGGNPPGVSGTDPNRMLKSEADQQNAVRDVKAAMADAGL